MTRLPAVRSRLRAPVALALIVASPLLAQQPYDISLRDGLLSIRANGAPITDLAAALAAETGVPFIVTGDGGTPITTEIVDEPLARAVAKLSPNHLLIKDGKSPDARVVEVFLMLDDASSGSGGGGDGFLPSGAPADEIVGGEEALPPDGSEFEPPIAQDELYQDALPEELAPDGSFAGDSGDALPMPDDGLGADGELPVAQ